jgi:alkyl hydroperoxide reductase subunit D
MTLNELMENLPPYARDLKLNFGNLLKQAELTEQQIWGTVVVSAITSRNEDLTRVALVEAANHLTPQALEAAKGAAAIMGMNNVYYRFLHLTSNQTYASIPARLRMQVIRSHGVEPADFELWCVAASAINACGACVDSHEKVVREKGMSEETILAAVRIASVIHGLAAVLDAEKVAPTQAVTA